MPDIDTPEQRAREQFRERGVIDPEQAGAVAAYLALANGEPDRAADTIAGP